MDTVTTLNVLFVHGSRYRTAPWLDASTRYRCYHLAEALRSMGGIADVTALPEVRLSCITRYHLVCVLRPHGGRALERLLNHCRKSGIPAVADVDDLVFDPQQAASSPSVLNGQASEISVRKRFASHLQALLCFDQLIVSTNPLASHWSRLTNKANVTVVPNGLSKRWLSVPVRPDTSRDDTKRTITYLPGSSSHDRDFSEITPVLLEFLHRNKHVRLQLVGVLNIDASLFPERQLIKSPRVDYFRLPQIIAESTLTIAPLVPSPFANAKSHIKFIESAAFGTPVICSPTDDICRHNASGLSIASDPDEWASSLDEHLNRPLQQEALCSMQQKIRKTATAEFSANILLAHWGDASVEGMRQAA